MYINVQKGHTIFKYEKKVTKIKRIQRSCGKTLDSTRERMSIDKGKHTLT